MRFKNQELLTSAILYLFPWTGSLFGGWYLAEGILPSHRYEIPAAVLTLLWAYGAYPLYCRIAARNGLDPVRMTAFYICPGVLGVMMASVLAVRPTAFPERSLFCPAAVPFPDLLHHSRQSLLVCPSGPVRQPPDRVPKGLTLFLRTPLPPCLPPYSYKIKSRWSAALFLPLSFFAPHPQSFAPIHIVRRVKSARHRVSGLRRDGQPGAALAVKRFFGHRGNPLAPAQAARNSAGSPGSTFGRRIFPRSPG